MDKMREDFENWAVSTKDHFGVPFFTIKNANGKYVDHGTEISWQAWQASRQALVVELPKLLFNCEIDAIDYVDTVKAIKSAGIKYK